MSTLSRADLWSLEEYAEIRPSFRSKVMEHKKKRQLALGDHARLYFEDRLTIKYQIQEMLRIEKVFEASGINEELDSYNPLIPDGHNWKATLLIEYTDVAERQAALARLVGIEDQIWMQVGGHERVYAHADEDMERSTADKTAAVHFLRFELAAEMRTALRGGASITAGVSHPEYLLDGAMLPELVRESLLADLD